MKEKSSYSVPDGYFCGLERRLSEIPQMQAESRLSGFRRMEPYLALAASFIAIFIFGTVFLNKTTPGEDSDYEQFLYADIIPYTDPYAIFGSDDSEEAITDEDLVNYLINNETTLDLIGYETEE